MKLTNPWNRLIYRLWSPIYDGLFDRFFAAPGRRRAAAVLGAQPGERVLLAGIGTGADLPLLPAGVTVVGVDLSSEMLVRAHAKLSTWKGDALLVEGDAQQLPLPEGSFDAAMLNLVLSVVPDAVACLREVVRTLAPGGRIVVFDKFVADSTRPRLGRRLLNRVTMLIGTDITRRLGDIIEGSRCRVVHDEPSLLRGAYRVIVLQPTAEERG